MENEHLGTHQTDKQLHRSTSRDIDQPGKFSDCDAMMLF
jgi:hypothetical protein